MISGINFLLITGIVIAETISQTLVREYRGDLDKKIDWKKNYYFAIIAFLLYAVVIYLLIKTYDHSNFAISNALWDSGTIIATTLVGIFWFKEKMNNWEYAGISLVIIGALIIGFKSDDKSDLVHHSLGKNKLLENKDKLKNKDKKKNKK